MQRLIIPSINIPQLTLWNVDISVYSRFIEQSDGMPRLHTLTLYEQGELADIGILLTLIPHLEKASLDLLKNRYQNEVNRATRWPGLPTYNYAFSKRDF